MTFVASPEWNIVTLTTAFVALGRVRETIVWSAKTIAAAQGIGSRQLQSHAQHIRKDPLHHRRVCLRVWCRAVPPSAVNADPEVGVVRHDRPVGDQPVLTGDRSESTQRNHWCNGRLACVAYIAPTGDVGQLCQPYTCTQRIAALSALPGGRPRHHTHAAADWLRVRPRPRPPAHRL
jgi:hypothetical protein